MNTNMTEFVWCLLELLASVALALKGLNNYNQPIETGWPSVCNHRCSTTSLRPLEANSPWYYQGFVEPACC